MSNKKYIIVKDKDKLHRVSEKVDCEDIKSLVDISYSLLKAYDDLDGKCQGISAIQIDIPVRAFLIRWPKVEEPTILFNPIVLLKIGKKKSVEGCLSENGDLYVLNRPRLVLARFYEYNIGYTYRLLTYKRARIFMHEYDHLSGILISDKGEKLGV